MTATPEANTNRITDNQKKTLRRILENDGAAISPDVARQLIRRGLALKVRPYARKEWNRTVATLWKVILTDAGRTYTETLL